jgi:hypothetical protein
MTKGHCECVSPSTEGREHDAEHLLPPGVDMQLHLLTTNMTSQCAQVTCEFAKPHLVPNKFSLTMEAYSAVKSIIPFCAQQLRLITSRRGDAVVGALSRIKAAAVGILGPSTFLQVI